MIIKRLSCLASRNKNIIVFLMLTITMGIKTEADSYYFINHTNTLMHSGQVFKVTDEQGNTLKILGLHEKEASAIPARDKYLLYSMSGDKTTTKPTLIFRPKKKSTKRVVEIFTLGKINNPYLSIQLLDLEKAKKKYKDITFPE